MADGSVPHGGKVVPPRRTLKPMPLWQAALFFGIPALLYRLIFYSGMPLLLQQGLAEYWAYTIAFGTPLALLLIAAFVAYFVEGNPASWTAIKARFRLKSMTGRAWLWATGLFLLSFVIGGGFLSMAARALAEIPIFAPPAWFPAVLRPGAALSDVTAGYMGIPLRGNWLAALAVVILFALNMFGEELWWRGYILPRQELAHGSWTWAIHGVLWALFHLLIYPWQWFTLLPICLSIGFVCQRFQNTMPGLYMHMAYNLLPPIVIVLAVAGLIR